MLTCQQQLPSLFRILQAGIRNAVFLYQRVMLHIVPCKCMQFKRICSKICRTQGSRTAPPPVEPPVPLPLLCFLLRKPVPTPSLPSKRPSSTALICSVMTLRIIALCLYLSIHNKQSGLANWKGIVRLFESLRLKQEQEPLIGHHRQLSVTLQQHCCYATQRKVSGEVSILKGLKHLKGASSLIQGAGLSSALVELVSF